MTVLNTAKRCLQFFRIGLAAKKLQRTQNEAEHLLAKRALVSLFADARGITMKVGQLFAGTDGATPFQEMSKGERKNPGSPRQAGHASTGSHERLDDQMQLFSKVIFKLRLAAL
jgi:hypothetical protein